MMKTILEHWKDFEIILPQNAKQAQRDDMRVAFYLGATAMFETMLSVQLEDDSSTAESMGALRAECMDFILSISPFEEKANQ